MNWSCKFAFDKMDDVYKHRPWLLDVDVQKEEEQLKEPKEDQKFQQFQNGLMMSKKDPWGWFKKTIRGRFFEKLNLTTVVTVDGSEGLLPEQEESIFNQVRRHFPTAAIFSFLGKPKIVSATEQFLPDFVTPEILSEINSFASQQKWRHNFEKTAMQKEADLRQIRDKWTAIAQRFIGGFAAGTAIGLAGLTGWASANAWMLEQQVLEKKAINPSLSVPEEIEEIEEKILADNIPETLQNSAEPENTKFQAENAYAQPAIEENPPITTETVDITTLVDRIIQVESSGNPNATSPVGARGLMQIMPRTWQEWSAKVFGREIPFDQAYDSNLNVKVGTAYLEWIQDTLRSWMEQEPETEHILAAYNGGIGRLRQVGFDVSQMPSESRNYVQKITVQKQSSSAFTIFHHAYQEMDKAKGKQIVRQLIGYPWFLIVEELKRAGIPEDLFGELYGVYTLRRSSILENTWSHKYAVCEAG